MQLNKNRNADCLQAVGIPVLLSNSWSLSNLVPRMLKGDFEPGSLVKHSIKDMNIALDEAEQMGMDTPELALSKSLYQQLAEKGEEDSSTQAIYKYWKS